MASKNTGSLISSIASSLNKEDKKNIKKEIKETKEEKTVNRSYNLKMSTVKKLQRLKVLVFEDSDLTYNEIVDKADRKSTRLNSSHANISYAVFCLKKKTDLHTLQY